MFESVVGHEEEKNILKESFLKKSVSHAYLFSGTEGIGKKLLAREFAKVLLGTNNLETCIDFKFIEKLEDKKDIIVEQIREKLVNDVYISPATSKYKVYIINDAHLMNISCQNALLKTLEEPPEYTVIILITHLPQTLLSTVLSRVNKITFKNLSNSDLDYITNNLKGRILDKDKRDYAAGSAKVALELIEDTDNNKYIKLDKFYNLYKNKDILEMTKLLDDISFKDDEVFNYLEYLYLKGNDYNKISLIENARIRMGENANELILKQALVIELIRKEQA